MTVSSSLHNSQRVCLSVILLLLAQVALIIATPVTRDVCIVGGGIGGMSAAVFLKDRGYNPLVIEKRHVIGGDCNTVTFPVANSSLPNWIDIGVLAFPNTTFFTEAGFGGWSIDSVAFFQRFAEVGEVPIPLTAPSFDVDLTTGLQVSPPIINVTEFEIALNSFLTFLATNSWLTTLLDIPDPFPSELLVPFDEFIVSNGYQPLVPIFRTLIGAGTTNYSSLSAFEGIRIGANVIGVLSLIGGPGNEFSVVGGCIKLYDGMAAYIGSENIKTKVDLITSVRPIAGLDYPTTLAGTILGSDGVERPFIEVCEKVIVAFPPVLSDLESFLSLDHRERSLFSKVRYFDYYVTTAAVEGNLTSGPFVVDNFQENQLYGLPVAPAFVYMFRGYSYGPAALGMNAPTHIPLHDMLDIAQEQLDRTPDNLLSSINLSTEHARWHLFNPYFLDSELATSPTAYTRLANLQGHRNTYYAGSLITEISHVTIINQAQGFIAANFPSLI